MPTSSDIFDRLSVDRSHRLESSHPIPVFVLDGAATELLPPGAGMLVMAHTATAPFTNLSRAVAAKDHNTINTIVNQQKQEVAHRRPVSMDQALTETLNAAVYGDLSYAGKLVAVNVFPTDNVSFARTMFPYAGGKITTQNFHFTQYAHATGRGPAPSLQAFVVLHTPKLSAREKSILDHLPPETATMQFGPSGPDTVTCLGTPAALTVTLTVAIIVAGAATAVGSCIGKFEGMNEVVLPPDLNLNSGLAVKQLVEARRKALLAA